ncbi:hypothetical protein [Micromonospora sp. NPDC005254]|uniref:hypothetical protein n=1 Tax=Micromonospora sp. NPDC005254 TaxID=3364229 RepID=UPI0036AA3F6A
MTDDAHDLRSGPLCARDGCRNPARGKATTGAKGGRPSPYCSTACATAARRWRKARDRDVSRRVDIVKQAARVADLAAHEAAGRPPEYRREWQTLIESFNRKAFDDPLSYADFIERIARDHFPAEWFDARDAKDERPIGYELTVPTPRGKTVTVWVDRLAGTSPRVRDDAGRLRPLAEYRTRTEREALIDGDPA